MERQTELPNRLAEHRFGPAAERLSAVLAGVTDADRLADLPVRGGVGSAGRVGAVLDSFDPAFDAFDPIVDAFDPAINSGDALTKVDEISLDRAHINSQVRHARL